MERRIKIFRISPEVLVELGKESDDPFTFINYCKPGLPADAVVFDCRVNAEWAYGRTAPPYIEVIVYSKEFDIIPEVGQIPEVEVVIHRRPICRASETDDD